MGKYNLNAQIAKDGRWNIYDGDKILSNRLSEEDQRELAHLFAAAPDLLEACERMVAFIRLRNDGSFDFINEMQAKAETAIAKARGEK